MMGIDCKVYLKRPCDMNDVAEILAVLLGNKHEFYKIGNSDSLFHKAEGYKFVTHSNENSFTDYGTIVVKHGVESWGFFYTVERKKGILLIHRSYALTIALFTRLARIYGGTVDYNDCDDVESDFEAPHPPFDTMPEEGEDWRFWQQYKHDLQPITDEEIAGYERYASYPRERV